MAREEHDREDLLREATALVERVELAPSDDPAGEHIVIGFRADGAASFYFAGEAAYHFNSDGELRRAHAEGLLFKAERGQLISLERVRTDNEVQLIRRPLSEAAHATFLGAMQERLRRTEHAISAGALVASGQVPADGDVLGRALKWLQHAGTLTVADSPHAR